VSCGSDDVVALGWRVVVQGLFPAGAEADAGECVLVDRVEHRPASHGLTRAVGRQQERPAEQRRPRAEQSLAYLLVKGWQRSFLTKSVLILLQAPAARKT
jgi:hypothetical protein